MVDFMKLSGRIFVTTVTYETLALYYYAGASETITVQIMDIYNNVADSKQYSVDQGYNEVNIADLINDATSNNKVSSGYYLLGVQEQELYEPIVFTSSLQGYPSYDQYIKKITVFDKNSMLYLDVNGDQVPSEDRFLSYVYMHDDQKNLGKILIQDGSNWIETDWAKYATVRITLTFNSVDDMAFYLSRYVWSNHSDDVVKFFGKLLNENTTDFVKIVAPYHLYYPFGDVINWNVDIDNKQIYMEVFSRLGFGWDSVEKALKYMAAGAVVGTTIIGAIGLTLATGGIGAILGGAAVGASIVLAYGFLKTNTNPTKEQVDNAANQGIQNVKSRCSEAQSRLDYYHNQGDVDNTAYNDLKNEINNICNTATQSIYEIKNYADNAYQSGYEKGASKWKEYAILTGFGGLALGAVIKK